MKDFEFYAKYANTPLKDRFRLINVSKAGLTTLSDIYERVGAIDNQIRPFTIEKDSLIELAEEFYNLTEKESKGRPNSEEDDPGIC